MSQNRKLRHVKGTEECHGIYHLKMHMPLDLQNMYDKKVHARRSLRTSDPRQAEREVTLQKAEFHEKRIEKEARAGVVRLVSELPPDQKALYDESGTVGGVSEIFQVNSP